MQNPLKMLGDLNKMRQQATQIQADLEKQEYTVEKGRIKIVITGNQRIVAAMIDGQNVAELVEILNDSIRQSQQAAAAKLAEVSKQMGLGQ